MMHGKQTQRADSAGRNEEQVMSLLLFAARMYHGCMFHAIERGKKGKRYKQFPLYVFFDNGKPVERDQRELADMLGLTPATITDMLQYLEREKMIYRVENPDDMRQKRIGLTPKGEQATYERRQIAQDKSRQALNGVGEEEQTQLFDILHQLCHNLSDMEGSGKGAKQFRTWHLLCEE
jgi:Transcriptional regulators